jgi:hypothetical protein
MSVQYDRQLNRRGNRLSTIDNQKGPRLNLSGCSRGFMMLSVREASIGFDYIGKIAGFVYCFADMTSLCTTRTLESMQDLGFAGRVEIVGRDSI